MATPFIGPLLSLDVCASLLQPLLCNPSSSYRVSGGSDHDLPSSLRGCCQNRCWARWAGEDDMRCIKIEYWFLSVQWGATSYRGDFRLERINPFNLATELPNSCKLAEKRKILFWGNLREGFFQNYFFRRMFSLQWEQSGEWQFSKDVSNCQAV